MTTILRSVSAKFMAVTLTIVMSLTLIAPSVQADATTDALQAQINALLAQLNALEGDSSESSADAGQYVHHPSIDFEFTRNLYVGDRGTDVMMLQKALNTKASTQVSASGPGSPGNETEYFGPATRASVAAFQAENGISPVAGYFWPLTRAEMNRKAPGTPSEGTPSGDGDLNVSGGDHPKDSVFAPGQQLVVFTAIELTAGDDDVVLEELHVQVNGEDSDSSDVIDKVVLMDEDMVVLDEDAPDSDDLAELDLKDLEIEDGETVMLWIAANINSPLTDDDAEFTLELVDLVSDADDVEGLPVEGAEHTLNSDIDLAEIDIDLDHETTSDVEIGTEEELIVTMDIQSSEDDDVWVRSIRLEFGSLNSIDEDEIDNVELHFDNDKVADGDVDSNGITFMDIDVKIEDGDSEEFEVFMDIVGGATEDIQLVVEETHHVIVMDKNDRILPLDGGSTLTDGTNVVSVNAGEIDLSDSDEVNSGSIAVGEEEAELVAFEFEVEGESVLVDDVNVTIEVATITNTDADDLDLDNIEIRDANGDKVAGAEDDATFTLTDPNTVVVNFEDVEFPEAKGDDAVYYIVADLTDDVEHGTEYTVTDIAMTGIEGVDSDETIANPTALSGLSDTQTVKGASLEVGMSSAIDEDETLDDEKDIEVGILQLDATDSGEDVTVKELDLDLTIVQVAGTPVADDVSNCELFNEDGDSVSDSVDFDGTGLTDTQEFDLDDIVVPAGDLMPLSLRCDISNDFDGTDTFEVDVTDAGAVDADGEVTTDIVATLSGSTPVTMTVIDGSLTTSDEEDADPAISKVGILVSLGQIEIESDLVEGVVEEMTVVVSDRNLLASGKKVEIHLNGEHVGNAVFGASNTDVVEDNQWLTDAEISDGQNIVEFWAKTAASVATEGTTLSANISSVNDVEVDGDLYPVTTTTITGVNVYSAVPVITKVAVTSSDITDNVIAKFAIKADGNESVVVDFAAVGLTVSTSGSASFTAATEQVEEANSSYESKNGTAAGVITITKGATKYFVVTADAVAEGDNGDIIEVSLDFTPATAVQVKATDVTPIEGGDLNNSGELISKYTN